MEKIENPDIIDVEIVHSGSVTQVHNQDYKSPFAIEASQDITLLEKEIM
jgi:hypothetical protein